MATAVLRAESLAKSFGPVTALRDISMHLEQGEVLGLIGDNGAGKSTLIKVLSGYHQPDDGTITWDGEETSFSTPAKAIGPTSSASRPTIWSMSPSANDIAFQPPWSSSEKPSSMLRIGYRLMRSR